ncbi:MAG: GtrA family protein [Lewinellaceae bacterium]|nr:GtrA family protein [Lewinellaceae bacterium]
MGRYCSTSVIATSTDFAVFHVALTYAGASPVPATLAGRSAGALVAFGLHRKWVFKNPRQRSGNIMRINYVLGILIGMLLNAGGVWLLNGVAGVDPWPARIVTAVAVWLFGFLFNKKMVFS